MTSQEHIRSRKLFVATFGAAIAMMAIGCSVATEHGARGPLSATVVEGPRLPVTTAGNAGGVIDGKPVVAGGSSWSADKTTKRWLTECFVCRDGKWIAGPSLPQPLSDPAYASDASGMYIAGGTAHKVATDQVLRLTTTAESAHWETMPSLPVAVEGASGAILSHTFYVFGGFSQDKASNALWALDIQSKNATWKALSPLPADGRGYCAFVALNSDLYLFGGFTSPPYTKDVTIFGDAYRYEPTADRWTRLQIGDLPGYGWNAAAVSKTEIMLAGRVMEIGKISDEILVIDVSTGQTQSIGKLMLGACCAPLMQTGKQTWWFTGGEPDTNSSRSDRTSIISLETLPRP